MLAENVYADTQNLQIALQNKYNNYRESLDLYLNITNFEQNIHYARELLCETRSRRCMKWNQAVPTTTVWSHLASLWDHQYRKIVMYWHHSDMKNPISPWTDVHNEKKNFGGTLPQMRKRFCLLTDSGSSFHFASCAQIEIIQNWRCKSLLTTAQDGIRVHSLPWKRFR
jgi:hypothetical protein